MKLKILLLTGLFMAFGSPSQGRARPEITSPTQALSIEIIDNVYLLTQVKVNGHSRAYRFMVDTGSSKTMVSRQIANELGLEVIDIDSASDGHSYQKFEVASIYLDIEGLSFQNLKVDISDYDMSANGQLCQVDGILGGNALKKFAWSFKGDQLFVQRKIAKQETEDFLAFKMKLMFNTPTLMAGYHGIKSTTLIDFGFNGSFLVQEKNLEYLHGRKIKKGSGQSIKTLFDQNKAVESKLTLLPEFDFGDFKQVKKQQGALTLKNVVADVEDEVHFDVHSIGTGILEYYDILLDYPKKKVYVRKVKNSSSEYGDATFGFHMNVETHLIDFIWDDSPASQLGLKLGDELIQINSLDLTSAAFTSLSSCEKHQHLRSQLREQSQIKIVYKNSSGQQKSELLERRALFAQLNTRQY